MLMTLSPCLTAKTLLMSRHNSIKITIEFEQAKEIPFLDILVKRCPNNIFITSIYRKKTFTGLHTKWDSFTPRKYKINLIRTLTYRCFRICSTSFLLQSAVEDLKRLLLKNGYPRGIINFNILHKNKNKPVEPIVTVPKKDIIILLPYTGFHSDHIVKRLKSCVNRFYSFVNCKVIFQNTRRIKSFFPFNLGPSQPITTMASHHRQNSLFATLKVSFLICNYPF